MPDDDLVVGVTVLAGETHGSGCLDGSNVQRSATVVRRASRSCCSTSRRRRVLSGVKALSGFARPSVAVPLGVFSFLKASSRYLFVLHVAPGKP